MIYPVYNKNSSVLESNTKHRACIHPWSIMQNQPYGYWAATRLSLWSAMLPIPIVFETSSSVGFVTSSAVRLVDVSSSGYFLVSSAADTYGDPPSGSYTIAHSSEVR